jgi:glycosyltransferase involved in cell wall biosynthesis
MAEILVVGKFYAPFSGGIEENTKAVAEGLARDHHIIVICNNHERGSAEETIGGVRVIRTSTQFVWKSQPIGVAIFLKAITLPADVVHFHAPNPWLSLALLLRMTFRKNPGQLVITHHMDIYGRPVLRMVARNLYNRLLKKTALIIATSYKNIASSDDIRTACNAIAIPLGLDMDRYALSAEDRSTARDWGMALSGGRPIVAFVGRHARYKGLDVLVKALALDPDLFGLIAGDGPYTPGIREEVARAGVQDRVKFLGSISHAEKLRLLAAADVFAFPSTEKTEAYGISQVEAMAMGAPVVASNLPTGVTDVARAGETAVVVEPGDPIALRNAIVMLLSDADMRDRLSAAAYKNVSENLTNTRLIEQTVAAIEQYAALPGLNSASEG